ncbi:MAG: hypothetical protein H6538_03665 [Bacteroidales bacterium]|nr:hypothetical protein [Bacteroidales bacterium]
MKINSLIRKAALSFISVLILQSSFCQENYFSGQIIELNGDTINGFIDYQNWKKNPEEIHFMHEIGSIHFTLLPKDIRGFNVADESYESAVIKSETSSDKTDQLTFNRDLHFETDTVFLQTMVKGEKSLYFYENKSGKDQFYYKTDTSYELLVYKRYLKKQDSNTIIVENNLYKGQLAAYLHDCPEVQSRLRYIHYDQQSLESLFNYYYSKTMAKVNFQKTTEKLKTEFGILAGASISTLKFKSYYFNYLENTNYGQSLNFTGGLFFDLIFPRNFGKSSFCNEFIYTTYKLDGKAIDNANHTRYTEFGYSYIKLNNMLRYRIPVNNTFLFFNAGLSNGIAINEINNQKTDGLESGRALNYTRNHEQGFLFGGGIKDHNFSGEIRIERGNGMSIESATKSTTIRYYLLFGYTF